MAILPRPEVSVSEVPRREGGANHEIAVTINRDGKGATHSGSGSITSEAVKQVVEKILSDPKTAEWLP